MYNKKTNRLAYKSNRRSGYKRNNNFSQSKGRNRGNVVQMYNKYLKLAKETFTTDRVQSEYYYQFTDHYFRLMVELGINIEENNQIEDSKQVNIETSNSETSSSQSNNDTEVNKENYDSIESIPFIAEPSKEKRSRSSK